MIFTNRTLYLFLALILLTSNKHRRHFWVKDWLLKRRELFPRMLDNGYKFPNNFLSTGNFLIAWDPWMENMLLSRVLSTVEANITTIKSNFSIVLFAVVDADYNFIFVDIGCQGRISDGGVFKNSSIYKKIMDNTLGLPEDQLLHTINKNMPFVFLADEAFALTNRIMKPYSGMHEKGTCQRKFNYRLSRARRVVENAFGILSAVFRVLRKPILLEPEKARYIVMTTVCLHNFLRRNKQSRNVYTPSGTFDEEDGDGNLVPGNWRIEYSSDLSSFLPIKNLPRKSSMDAKEDRNNFAAYFLNT
nr:unnamed protein product [Callosobruchus analis]